MRKSKRSAGTKHRDMWMASKSRERVESTSHLRLPVQVHSTLRYFQCGGEAPPPLHIILLLYSKTVRAETRPLHLHHGGVGDVACSAFLAVASLVVLFVSFLVGHRESFTDDADARFVVLIALFSLRVFAVVVGSLLASFCVFSTRFHVCCCRSWYFIDFYDFLSASYAFRLYFNRITRIYVVIVVSST